jgi:hypothetical protein
MLVLALLKRLAKAGHLGNIDPEDKNALLQCANNDLKSKSVEDYR